MKRLLMVICLCFMCFNLNSQSAFIYDIYKDIGIGIAALSVSIAPFFMNNEPETNPAGLNSNDIFSFDRAFMASYNDSMDILSYVGLYSLFALPLISLSGNFTNKDALLTYGIMYTQSILLVYGTTEILKCTTPRYRPFSYFGDNPSLYKDDYYKSFPSRHAAFAFMSASFFTTTFFTENPESSWKIPILLGSYTLATTVSALRIGSGVHFVTDVLAGAAIGTFFGWAIPMLHKRQNPENKMALNITGNGIIVTVRF